MKATALLRARLHEVTQQFLRDLSDEMARMRGWKPKPAKGARTRRLRKTTKRSSPPVHQTAPRIAVEKGEALAAQRPKQAPQGDRVDYVPTPSNESAKPEPPASIAVSSPAKRWGLPTRAPAQPKPAGAPALMGAPRAPLVGAGRGRSAEALSDVSRRGAEAAKASRATDRALGPAPKRSLSDAKLEAWAAERLAAGDLPAEMTLPTDELDEPHEVPASDDDTEEDEG